MRPIAILALATLLVAASQLRQTAPDEASDLWPEREAPPTRRCAKPRQPCHHHPTAMPSTSNAQGLSKLEAESPLSTSAASSQRTISVFIDRSPGDVYDFVRNPANYVPEWATGPEGVLAKVGNDWQANTPMGKVTMRFAPRNRLGILDHDFVLESGQTIHNPMRVVAKANGAELIRTLRPQAEAGEAELAEEAQAAEKDLQTIKTLLEQSGRL